MYHLTSLERNRREAQKIAAKIIDYQNRYPGRPVSLVGYSGGAGMAIMAIEALPPQRRVSRVVLLAAALSPHHDLSTALARTEGGIWNFYSPFDAVALRLGTLTLGTIDRQHVVSAGAVGFAVPERLGDVERFAYAQKLHQKPFDPRMALSGYLGGHVTVTGRKFVATWIAPILGPTRATRTATR